eukprot:CAMPEP_0114364430 /NCGR_PEP_ID=MMETSP0101-20121206/27502_1 /TAXON_ID=38822 ORGANISM="Pteridomonas danica, Strain PT" /NCGR_SAMPLE_ID=MMETSP0101 /ASSEMBLY_ACC=CAM_ASM_000211 /LENGTH=788 /DNA_ID=CAMNT_0001511951 /DNA_START=35 /DNA_END=2401 /DNA_ORIENTATION=-
MRGSRPRSASAQRRSSQSDKEHNNGASVGGARGIRNLRKNRDPEQENIAPSQNSNERFEAKDKKGKKSARVDAARAYLANHVDPLMAEIINFLLSNQPEEADQAILSFLEARQNNETQVEAKPRSSDTSRNAVLRDRQYMARTVQPVLERLMRRVVEDQPLDVEAHFIEQLKLSPSINEKSNQTRPKTPSKPAPRNQTTLTNRVACDALFRILDEHSKGFLTPTIIIENIRKFHSIGVPMDSLAVEFWLDVSVGVLGNESIDQAIFFKLMGSVALKVPLDSGPKLSSFLEPSSVSKKPNTEAAPPTKPQSSTSLSVGTPVTVDYKKSGNFFDGKVKTCRPDGDYDIIYDDGDSENKVPLTRIRVKEADNTVDKKTTPKKEPAVSQSESVSASARVEVNYKNTGKFYAGSVAVVNSNGTFNIGYDDGDSEKNVPLDRIRLLNPITGAVVPIPGSATDEKKSSKSPTVEPAVSMKPVIALVGVSGAGKSTLLKAMGGDPDPKPRPTTGFSQKKLPFEVQGSEVSVHWYDLPGSWTKKWEGYLTECHGVVFVVDSAADEDALTASMNTFNETVSGTATAGKPLLVLANKQDAEESKNVEEISSLLQTDQLDQSNMKVIGSVVHPEKNGGEFDSRVEKGLEWLLDTVSSRFSELNDRVKKDEAAAAVAAKIEKQERHKRVFSKLLQEKAFPKEGEPIETFSEVDSYEFLAMELLIHDPQVPERTRTAEEDWGLSDIAKRVVHLVGCQKMAMIMVADMINPESKKTKVTHTWEEVIAYIQDRREDAGLSRDIL